MNSPPDPPRPPSREDGALAAYAFDLPKEAIAQEPLDRRDASRLFVLQRRDGSFLHREFADLPAFLRPGDLLVLNDTRVIPARVLLRRASGGAVPGLLLEAPAPGRPFRMMLEGRGRLRAGERLLVTVEPAAGSVAGDVAPGLVLEHALGDGVWRVRPDPPDAGERLFECGRMPLPPYIRRDAAADARDRLDRERYQTVFAQRPGAVAAPTAGLHFTEDFVERLAQQDVGVARVTLHVGPGTFLPVRADDLAQHVMHGEEFEVPEATARAIALTRAAGNRVIAVGTTVTRALESAARRADGFACRGVTDLFIRPPFTFRVVDALLTNFHLPQSTLLVLVAAFAGREQILAAYREAVAKGYRFYSYGDAMLVT